MTAIDDVHFGQRLIGALAQFVEDLFERHRVRAGIAGLEARERAEQAAGDADVRGLEAQIEVVKRPIAVTPLTFAIREPAEGVQVRTRKQALAVGGVEPLARVELVDDVAQAESGEVESRHGQTMPMTCTRIAPVRGPSSSASRMRVHW